MPEIRKRLYAAISREPKNRSGAQPLGLRSEAVLGTLSGASLLLMLVPPREGYVQPISTMLERGDSVTRLWLGVMILMLAYLAAQLWRKDQYLASLSSIFTCGFLLQIARTNSVSADHHSAFLFLVLLVLVWHWGLYFAHRDPRLGAFAAFATIGAFVCTSSLGAGERLLVGCSILTINLVYWEHLAD